MNQSTQEQTDFVTLDGICEGKLTWHICRPKSDTMTSELERCTTLYGVHPLDMERKLSSLKFDCPIS